MFVETIYEIKKILLTSITWPLIWGYKIEIPDSEKIVLHPIDGEELIKKYGGPLNVYIENPDCIKFRKRRDAVIFSLRNF